MRSIWNKSRFKGAALVVLLVLLVAAGCGGQEAVDEGAVEEEEPTTEKTVGDALIVASIGDASVINPILSNDTASGDIIARIFEGLITVNEKIEWIPELAEDWEFSEDGTVWTFYLREGVTWHDGEPFTAEDVKFTFEAIMHPNYEGSRRGNYTRFLGYAEYTGKLQEIAAQFEEGEITEEEANEAKLEAFEEWREAGAIEIVDEHTVRFHLTEAYAPFIADISMDILPAHVFDGDPGKAGQKDHPFNSKNPIGTGPFKFVKWSRDEEIVVEANEDYWGEGPYISKWIYRIIPDAQIIKQSLKTAEVDYGSIQPEDWEEMNEVEHLQTFEYATFSYTYMGYNLQDPMFQDPKVRRAITHAIDRKTIVDELLYGHGTLCNSHGSPARWDYNPDVPVYEYDPDKALELLAEAGWTDSDGDGILDKDGEKFSFKLQTNQGNQIREDSAVLIQDFLEEIGIEVEVEFVEWNTFVNNVLLAKDFEAVIVGWALGTDPDAYSIWHTDGGPLNFVSYSNERVDELLEKGRVTLEQEKRAEIYGEMQKILAEEQPYTFLYFRNTLSGLHERFEGPIAGTPAGIMWNINEWFVPADKQLRID